MARSIKKIPQNRIAKSKPQPNWLQKHSSFLQKFTAVIVVGLVTVVGTYAVIHSHAQGDQGDGYAVRIQTGPEESEDHAAGTTFDVPIYGAHGMQGNPGQAVIMLSVDRNDVEYLGYTCASVTPCRSNSTHNGSLPPASHHIYAFLCFDAPFSKTTDNSTLFTVHLKARKHLPAPYEVNWLALWSGYAPGSCETNRDASNVAWGNGRGGCNGIGTDALCDVGSEVGFGPSPKSNDNSALNTNSKTSGVSGGNRSSTSTLAVKAGENNTSVPTTTQQGVASTQPSVEPSPFYDGRQFSPGSNDKVLFGDLTVAHHTVRYGYILILCLIIACAAAGLAVWRYRRVQH